MRRQDGGGKQFRWRLRRPGSLEGDRRRAREGAWTLLQITDAASLTDVTHNLWRHDMAKGMILWILGIPAGIIILLLLFGIL
jgi:hypothetical protein